MALVVTSFVLLSCPSLIFVFFLVFTYSLIGFLVLLYCSDIYVFFNIQHRQKKSCYESYRQWQNKKCFSHSECQTWGTGNFCCGDSCCDELPEEEEEEYEEEYYYDYLDEEYIDKPWIDLDYKSSEDEVGDMAISD